jgi:hypothetical protein
MIAKIEVQRGLERVAHRTRPVATNSLITVLLYVVLFDQGALLDL